MQCKVCLTSNSKIMTQKAFIKPIVLIVLIAAFSSVFVGCENKPAMHGQLTVTVMKFKKPEYKNYVLANYREGDEYVRLLRDNSCSKEPAQPQGLPYWNLPDEWLLVDWRWAGFPYDAGLTLLTEQTWDKWVPDTIMESRIVPSWSISAPHIFQPVEKILYIKPDYLAKYLNKPYAGADIETIIHTISQDVRASVCDRGDWGDSIWAVLQNDLSIAIENGDLEHINDDKYNPYLK